MRPAQPDSGLQRDPGADEHQNDPGGFGTSEVLSHLAPDVWKDERNFFRRERYPTTSRPAWSGCGEPGTSSFTRQQSHRTLARRARPHHRSFGMDADVTAIKDALADVSETELTALIAATNGVPQAA